MLGFRVFSKVGYGDDIRVSHQVDLQSRKSFQVVWSLTLA